MLIRWADGVEESPGGLAREVVQHSVWSSSVWVTPTGECFRRYYNRETKRWTWEAMEVAFDAEQTRIGVHLQAGG